MYIRPEQIAEQYEMEVKSISKGRDCFLCETDLGMRALKGIGALWSVRNFWLECLIS